jgi:ketosteroid isomerase-like protein
MADDVATLTELNERFIEAVRQGSWEMLEPILSPGFTYLDGNTGQTRDLPPYREMLAANPAPDLAIDQLAVHVDGDAAIVSARTASATRSGRHSRYLDSYQRRGDRWVCVHACVWRLY